MEPLKIDSPCVWYHRPSRSRWWWRWLGQAVALGLFAMGSQARGYLSMVLLLLLIVLAFVVTEVALFFMEPTSFSLWKASIEVEGERLRLSLRRVTGRQAVEIEKQRIRSAYRSGVRFNCHDWADIEGNLASSMPGVTVDDWSHPGVRIELDDGRIFEIVTGEGDEGQKAANALLDRLGLNTHQRAASFSIRVVSVQVGLDGVRFLSSAPDSAWRNKAFLPWEGLLSVRREPGALVFVTSGGEHRLALTPVEATDEMLRELAVRQGYGYQADALVERCREARAIWEQLRGEIEGKAPPASAEEGYRSDSAREELRAFLRVGSVEQRRAAVRVAASADQGREALEEARDCLADAQARGEIEFNLRG